MDVLEIMIDTIDYVPLKLVYEPRKEKNEHFANTKNKGADQLGSNCEADQCLCFRSTDSSSHLLSKSKIASL